MLKKIKIVEWIQRGVQDNKIRQAIKFIEGNKSAKGDWKRINY